MLCRPRQNSAGGFEWLVPGCSNFPKEADDMLEYHVDKLSQRRNMWWYRGEAKVGDVLVRLLGQGVNGRDDADSIAGPAVLPELHTCIKPKCVPG